MSTTPNPTTDIAVVLRSGDAAGHWALDTQSSRAEIAVKHFWGAVTVRVHFEQISGEGILTAGGDLSGTLTFEVASLTTQNKQRDKHLKSAEFFDAENHPRATLTVTRATPEGVDGLTCRGTLEAAGHIEPVEFTARVQDLTEQAVTLIAEIVVDRTKFNMTWSPLRMAAFKATGTVTARFIRTT